VTLTAATAVPPLAPGQPPSLGTIPNNHRFYAIQWFFFAAAALVIYVLALRGRRRPTLPPEP
jgi:cytochrome oxidase assembly protein ShyY1